MIQQRQPDAGTEAGGGDTEAGVASGEDHAVFMKFLVMNSHSRGQANGTAPGMAKADCPL